MQVWMVTWETAKPRLFTSLDVALATIRMTFSTMDVKIEPELDKDWGRVTVLTKERRWIFILTLHDVRSEVDHL